MAIRAKRALKAASLGVFAATLAAAAHAPPAPSVFFLCSPPSAHRPLAVCLQFRSRALACGPFWGGFLVSGVAFGAKHAPETGLCSFDDCATGPGTATAQAKPARFLGASRSSRGWECVGCQRLDGFWTSRGLWRRLLGWMKAPCQRWGGQQPPWGWMGPLATSAVVFAAQAGSVHPAALLLPLRLLLLHLRCQAGPPVSAKCGAVADHPTCCLVRAGASLEPILPTPSLRRQRR